MEQKKIIQWGDKLYEAWRQCSPIAPLTESEKGLTIEEAYQIQHHFVERRLALSERIIGKKIGVTSKAVMSMLGVFQPDFGYLLDGMLYNEGESIPMDTLIQPKAEGEIAFLLKKDLYGPGIGATQVLSATEAVMPCFEIVDSRISNWKIAIQDTVADNASCGAIVLGDQLIDPRKVDLQLCGMLLKKNGEIMATGAGAAALGGPANAVAWLANTLGKLGIPLKAGEIILSGALTAMCPIKPNDFLAIEIGGIGQCSIRFH